MCLVAGWWRHFGTERPVSGMMHDFFLRVPGIGHYYRAIGAVSASRAACLAVLNAGRDVLVFPGGDIDACRPIHQPRRVDFGPRRGYIHVALDSGVPIVPMATIGSHYTCPMAPGGRLLARGLGLERRLRVHRVPLTLSPILLPARITSELLAPLDLVAATRDLPEGGRIEAAHALVIGALRDAVSRMTHDRPLTRATVPLARA